MGQTAQAIEWFSKCSDVFSADNTFHVKREKAEPLKAVRPSEVFEYPFIEINAPSYSVVHIDVDRVDCDDYPLFEPAFDIATFDYFDIPYPNYSVLTSDHRFHAFWLLERSLPFGASPSSLQFFSDVRQKIVHALDADPACNIRGAVRNPFYKEAQARSFTSNRYDLAGLNPKIEIPARGFRNNAHRYVEGNRNRTTFDVVLRYFKDSGHRAGLDELFQYAKTFQSLCEDKPLPDAENKTIAKSVGKNGHRYKVRANYNYGAMNLPDIGWSDMSEEERAAEIVRRQRAGAYWMHGKRKEKTRARLQGAVEDLQVAGVKVTQRAVSAQSGCSIKTVNRHRDILLSNA